MFSPYYAWQRRASRRRGGPSAGAVPERHCALNVAVYSPKRKRWAMTERGQHALTRASDRLVIGPSSLVWDGTTLCIRCDEVTVPLPSRLRGEIRLTPMTMPGQTFSLDSRGRHRWTPFAPSARIEVDLARPELSWTGGGYWDGNRGDEPLEDCFKTWDWSRTRLNDGSSVILYETNGHQTADDSLFALHFGSAGGHRPIEVPERVALERTRWGLDRGTRAENGEASVHATLEDTPFYSRSLIETHLAGERVTAMHESLSLERFRMPLVQCMLPFRMPLWR